MLNTFEETFEVTEMCTFKHEPFFIVGGGGGGGLIRGTLRYHENPTCATEGSGIICVGCNCHECVKFNPLSST